MRPVLFEIGSLPVRAYGLLVLAGFLLALAYAIRQAKRNTTGASEPKRGVITPEHVFDMSVIGLVIGILGARLLYILLNLPEYLQRPVDALKVWTGGLSIHGAIVAAVLWLAYYSRRHRIAFLQFADLCAPAFALGYAVGRLGCFLNGCCYGHACDLPWAIRFHRDGDLALLTPPSHPTQLYAAAFNLAFFAVLHLWHGRQHRTGDIFFAYLALYSVYRFIDEVYRRGASAEILGVGLTQAQVFSLLALPLITGVWLWVRRRSTYAHHPTGERGEIDADGRV